MPGSRVRVGRRQHQSVSSDPRLGDDPRRGLSVQKKRRLGEIESDPGNPLSPPILQDHCSRVEPLPVTPRHSSCRSIVAEAESGRGGDVGPPEPGLETRFYGRGWFRRSGSWRRDSRGRTTAQRDPYRGCEKSRNPRSDTRHGARLHHRAPSTRESLNPTPSHHDAPGEVPDPDRAPPSCAARTCSSTDT